SWRRRDSYLDRHEDGSVSRSHRDAAGHTFPGQEVDAVTFRETDVARMVAGIDGDVELLVRRVRGRKRTRRRAAIRIDLSSAIDEEVLERAPRKPGSFAARA